MEDTVETIEEVLDSNEIGQLIKEAAIKSAVGAVVAVMVNAAATAALNRVVARVEARRTSQNEDAD